MALTAEQAQGLAGKLILAWIRNRVFDQDTAKLVEKYLEHVSELDVDDIPDDDFDEICDWIELANIKVDITWDDPKELSEWRD